VGVVVDFPWAWHLASGCDDTRQMFALSLALISHSCQLSQRSQFSRPMSLKTYLINENVKISRFGVKNC
jgi:hypothetical protein